MSSASSYVGTITEVSPAVGVRASSAAQSTRCRLSTAWRQLPAGGRIARRRSGNRRRTPIAGTELDLGASAHQQVEQPAAGSAGSTGPRPSNASRWATSRAGSTSGAGPRNTTFSPLPRSPSSSSATNGPAQRDQPLEPVGHPGVARVEERDVLARSPGPARRTTSQSRSVCALDARQRDGAQLGVVAGVEDDGDEGHRRLSPATRRRTPRRRTARGRRGPRRGRRA